MMLYREHKNIIDSDRRLREWSSEQSREPEDCYIPHPTLLTLHTVDFDQRLVWDVWQDVYKRQVFGG